MKVQTTTIFYLLCIILTIILFYVLSLNRHTSLQIIAVSPYPVSTERFSLVKILEWFSRSQAIILLQVAIVIIVARLTGMLFKQIGQPIVMGEIVAGIILGPSVLGLLFPQFSEIIFSKSSQTNLQVLSNLGLLIFMFIIGIEFKIKVIKEEARTVFSISYVSILLPFLVGVVLAMTILKHYVPAAVPLFIYYLYIGVTISITSFTVLARILRDRGISNTRLGSLVISCTAINDIVAWCVLAFVIGALKAGSSSFAVYTFLMVITYIPAMIFMVKPFLKRLFENNRASSFTFFLIYTTLLLSAYISEVIGVHMLFGAFLAGAIMPESEEFRKYIVAKLENFAFVLLLPLYFAFTGLRTEFALLASSSIWVDCLVVVIAATGAKFIGCTIAAKTMGETVQNSISIGVLMNTRGLTELVVLNIGYELGILTPQLFTIMVVMAIFTTLVTSPLMNIINRRERKKGSIYPEPDVLLHQLSCRTESI